MDNAFRMLSDLVSNLTSVIVGILGLGIVGSLAFGDMMGLDVIGNITAGGVSSFITASNIIASTSLTGSNLHVNSLASGTSETRILVSDTSGNIKYRTNLRVTGPTGAKIPEKGTIINRAQLEP